MTENTEKYLVINYIQVENTHILVGVTDSERWQWDTEAGDSGTNARTHVWVILKKNENSGIDPIKEAYFLLLDEWREHLLACVGDLFDIAHEIHNQEFDYEQAREKYFGRKIFKK